jgi:hypothetical protein
MIFLQTALCCSIIAEAATCPDVHVPITCKIRVFDDVVRTVDFARMLQRSGWESRLHREIAPKIRAIFAPLGGQRSDEQKPKSHHRNPKKILYTPHPTHYTLHNLKLTTCTLNPKPSQCLVSLRAWAHSSSGRQGGFGLVKDCGGQAGPRDPSDCEWRVREGNGGDFAPC